MTNFKVALKHNNSSILIKTVILEPGNLTHNFSIVYFAPVIKYKNRLFTPELDQHGDFKSTGVNPIMPVYKETDVVETVD